MCFSFSEPTSYTGNINKTLSRIEKRLSPIFKNYYFFVDCDKISHYIRVLCAYAVRFLSNFLIFIKIKLNFFGFLLKNSLQTAIK